MPPKYKHLSARDQILLRPGQHIGSTNVVEETKEIVVVETQDGKEVTKIVKGDVKYNPGLLHIFYEVLSNAQDNYFRSVGTDSPLKAIKVTIEESTVTVWNDGMHIPVQMHKWGDDEENLGEMYDPELIFGHLNSSSNYDDDENARVGAGLHGVGVKLTNIFSTSFTVECYDPVNKKKFIQTYTNNLDNKTKPKITTLKGDKGYTKITYTFDESRFEGDGYDEDFYALVKKMCVDCAMVTGVKVSFNGEVFSVKDLLAYTKFYINLEESNYLEFKSKDTHLILTENEEKSFRFVSFVNGIVTPKGGVHLKEWINAIFKPLLEKIKKKYKDLKITPKVLQDHFCVFIKCNLENPVFEAQTKESLLSPKPKVDVPTSKITALMKWKFVDDIEEMMRIQGMKALAKTDGKKNESLRGVKVDDANKAKSKDPKECLKCTLYITEGDSAAGFVKAAIGVLDGGCDYNGIMPVKGKVLNVRDATAEKINANNEITTLKKVLRLQHGMDYSNSKNFETLRYGQIKLLTDADEDGHHIKGLLMNFFYCFYPSLVRRGYIKGMETPVIKVTISPSKKVIDFYYIKEFKKWCEQNPNEKFSAKYYKGLGSSKDEEVIEAFENGSQIEYRDDDGANEEIDKVFNKTRANDRKKWLETYTEGDEHVYPEENGVKVVNISEFVNKDFIGFSIYDNKRSIASMVDGFKTVQRKVMWAGLHYLTGTQKLTTFSSTVVSKAQYHHGEVSLLDTIVSMAQTFVGANNVTFFEEGGNFGSRDKGGKDAAAARYVSTSLLKIARYVFRKEDDPILTYNEDEGQSIEPKYFVPVVPLLLINGCVGIGTGYSTDVPSYKPHDLVEWIKAWIENEVVKENTIEYPDLVPWTRGFTGTIEKNGVNVTYTGIIEPGDKKNTYVIRELPVGVWTSTYKEKLEGFVDSNLISDFDTYNGKHTVNFVVKSTKDLNEKNLKLITTKKLTNLTAFKTTGGIRQYPSVECLLKSWCAVRHLFYKKRKKFTLNNLKEKLKEQESKSRFISEVLKDVTLLKQTEESLFAYFEKNEYYARDGGYRYLTDIPVRNFTQDKYETILKQIEETKKEIQYILKTSTHQMWIEEMDEFIVEYDKYTRAIEEVLKKLDKKKTTKNKKK